VALSEDAKLAVRKAASVPRATAVGFWRGLTYPFKGMRFVYFKHPGLVRFWIWPILITLILLGVSLWASIEYHDDLMNAVWAEPLTDGAWGWVLFVLWWIVRVLVVVMLCGGSVLAVVFLTNVIAAPFNDLLSEEVEHLASGKAMPRFSIMVLARDTVRTVGLEIVKLFLYVLVMGPLFVLSQFVPGVGPVLYSIIGFLFTAFYFSLDYVDWPASRRNKNIGYRFGMLKRHFLPMFGFGTGVWLFLFIPFVNLLFMPAAVAGGTLLFLDLEGEDAPMPAPPPASEAVAPPA
jgi:CysZ protein